MRRVLHQSDQFRWIDLEHPTREELEEAQREFQLHPIFVQDCLDPTHLPKFERQGSTVFLIVRLYDAESPEGADTIQSLTRKVALFMGNDFVVTIHRLDPDQFQQLIEMCTLDIKDKSVNGQGRLPLLLVSFLNRALRSFHTPQERAEEQLDQFESALFSRQNSTSMLQEVHIVKRRLSLIKRILIHSQDAVQRLSPPGEAYSPLFQDLRENVASLIFLTDELLEDATSLLNLQISLSAQKTNEVMRVLTVFSVFFMPLTFIVGVYGMNFHNQPEFSWEHGYAMVWSLMIVVTIGIGIWFYRKGWMKAFF
jgi:magnesium transporter